jgi:hypothetical protein
LALIIIDYYSIIKYVRDYDMKDIFDLTGGLFYAGQDFVIGKSPCGRQLKHEHGQIKL